MTLKKLKYIFILLLTDRKIQSTKLQYILYFIFYITFD